MRHSTILLASKQRRQKLFKLTSLDLRKQKSEYLSRAINNKRTIDSFFSSKVTTLICNTNNYMVFFKFIGGFGLGYSDIRNLFSSSNVKIINIGDPKMLKDLLLYLPQSQ